MADMTGKASATHEVCAASRATLRLVHTYDVAPLPALSRLIPRPRYRYTRSTNNMTVRPCLDEKLIFSMDKRKCVESISKLFVS